MFSIIEINKR